MSNADAPVTSRPGGMYTGATPAPANYAARARRWGWWYFAEHYARQLYRYALPLALNDILMPLAYILAIGVGLGSLIDANAGTVQGLRYLDFVAPALIIGVISQSAVTEVTYPVLSGFKWRRIYYAPAAGPLSGAQISIGHLLAASFRTLWQATIAIVQLAICGVHLTWGVLALLLIAPLGALALAAGVQAYAATVTNEGSTFTLLFRFLILPLTLFSGTYYALGSMPIWLQWIGWISPLWHASELTRWAAVGMNLSPGMIAVHVLFLLLCAGVGVAVSCRNYERRLRQ